MTRIVRLNNLGPVCRGSCSDNSDDHYHAAGIENRSEAASPAALDVERLAHRLLEGQRRQGGSVPLTNEYEARAYAAWLLGASDEAAAEYAGLRDKEER